MGTLRCEGCGEEFIVFHDPIFVDKAVAERQAHWLEKVLAEQERKHPDRIQLPRLRNRMESAVLHRLRRVVEKQTTKTDPLQAQDREATTPGPNLVCAGR
jgi:hypothetical protein